MKFSLLAAFAIVAFSPVGAIETKATTNLRSFAAAAAGIENKSSVGTTKTIATQVIVPGIKTGTGENHAPILEKCYVEAYNKHDMMGYKVDSFSAGKEVDVPDDADSEMLTGRGSASAYFYGHCAAYSNRSRRFWFDDDMLSDMTPQDFFQALDNPSAAALHAQFEEDLCACLKDSGVKAYKHSKECAVQYMYTPTPPVMVGSNDE